MKKSYNSKHDFDHPFFHLEKDERIVNGKQGACFVEAMDFKAPWLFLRFFGGALFVLGLFLMAFNLYKTVRMPAVHDAKHTVNEGA